MTHVYKLEDVQPQQPTMVTIGVFDGLHRGHQALIRRLVTQAHANGYQAAVLTFDPHPDVVLRGIEGRYYLTTPQQRAELMQALGVDVVVTHPFDDSIRQIRAADFVDRLVRYLRVKALWVGRDFALGYQREGNVDFLAQQGAQKGFTVQALDLIEHAADGEIINSSDIRKMLVAGDVATVRTWLGRGYAVRGAVVGGAKRGRTIGFPTANVDVWEQQIVPAIGVYAGWATVAGQTHPAVTNIGVRPTFAGEKAVTVEAHLLDFEGDLYGKTLTLTFETRLRDEQKFEGIEALKAQLARDVAAGRAFLGAAPPSK